MGKEKRIFTKPFAAALDHLIRVTGQNNDIVGEAAGYKSKGKAIDQIRNERSDGRPKYLLAIAAHFGYTHDGFVELGKQLIRKQNTGSMSGTAPAPTIQAEGSNVTRLDQLHWKVVEQFQQKDTALQINQELVEIEALDPAELKSILRDLRAKKNVIKEEQEAERKKREVGGDERD